LVAHNGSAKGEDDENRSEKISIMGGRDYYFLVDNNVGGSSGKHTPQLRAAHTQIIYVNQSLHGWMDGFR